MRDPYAFLGVHAVSRLVGGSLVPLLALLVTGSFSIDTLATCVIAAAVVRLCLIPILAPLLDRWNPVHVLFRCELGVATITLATAVGLLGAPLPAVFWVGFFVVNAVIQSFEGPAFPKVVVRIVGADQLTTFTSWESALVSFARFAGPALAGFLLLVLSTERALLIVLIAPSLLTLPVYWYMAKRFAPIFQPSVREVAPAKALEARVREWMHGVGAGFRFRWAIVTERYLGLQIFLELAVIVPTFGILLPFLVANRQWEASWLGWLEAASGAGLVAGSLLAPKAMELAGRWRLGVASTYAPSGSLHAPSASTTTAALRWPLHCSVRMPRWACECRPERPRGDWPSLSNIEPASQVFTSP